MRKIDRFVRSIHTRLNNNDSDFRVIVGRSGSGKSWSALSIAELTDPKFDPKKNIIYDGRIQPSNIYSGATLIGDDWGALFYSRDFNTKGNKGMAKVLQVIRRFNVLLLVTVPSLTDLDVQFRRKFRVIRQVKRGLVIVGGYGALRLPTPSTSLTTIYERESHLYKTSILNQVLKS